MYFALLDESEIDAHRPTAHDYLNVQLEAAAGLESDLPDDVDALEPWLEGNVTRVGREYQRYLAERRAGAPRRFFSSRAHALYFLESVAPTKLVDGAWLYGLTHRWRDPRLHALIRIYLEELGEGQPEHNHVAIYRRLIASHGCDGWQRFSDSHFVQGAIQLALAHNAEHFLPELIGYNLGYEQLPLHLLITAYELNELDIDPFYFSLHVTVDNADSGHAKQAVRGVLNARPLIADPAAFRRRLANGYRLNMLGEGAHSVVEGFDLEREVIAMLQRKSTFGKFVHSDYVRIDGYTVTDWLADPAHIPAFLDSLQKRGWIKRHQPPRNSRFWRLIQGDQATMYGVFNAYEQQLIHDWIAGDRVDDAGDGRVPDATGSDPLRQESPAAPAVRLESADDFNRESHLLEQQLAEQGDRAAVMDLLARYLSPTRHHTEPGLTATRRFASLLE